VTLVAASPPSLSDALVPTLGERVKRLRIKAGMSQRRLANAAGVEAQTISNLETGRTQFVQSWDVAVKLAESLGGLEPVDLVSPQRRGEGNDEDRPDWRDDHFGKPREMPPIPEFHASVAAGGWADLGDPVNFGSYDGIHAATLHQGLMIVQVFGRSMAPAYQSGVKVMFRVVRPEAGDELTPGRDYLVCDAEGRGTFKNLRGFEDDELVLAARNQADFPGEIRVPLQEVTRIAEFRYKLEEDVPAMPFDAVTQ